MRSGRALLKLVAAMATIAAVPAMARKQGELIYIGMHGPQIHAARFNAETGTLSAVGAVAENPRPTWAVRHPTLPIIYFVNQTGGEGKTGSVQAFRVDRKTGGLVKFSEVSAGAGGTTHLTVDRPSMTIVAANFDGAVSTLPIARDGSLGEAVSIVTLTGSGPHRRQAGAHAHAVEVDPSGRFVLVPDLGSDRVWVLPFDRKTRKLGAYDAAGPRHYVAAPGSGPRHLAFDPRGRTVYLVNELTASVDVLRWDAKAGTLSRLQTIPTDDPAFSGNRSAAEIAVSADGRFVYVSSRSDHMIVAFAVETKTGMLRLIERVPSGGALPWHFSIDRTGNWLLVANRDADAVGVFSIERATGKLTAAGKSLASPKPVHVIFSGQ